MSSNEKDIITNDTIKTKLLGKRSHTMKIRTGGRPSQYTITKGLLKKSRRISLASIRKARTECGISGRQAEKFVSIAVRESLGSNSVEPGLHQEMTKMNHIFDDVFAVECVDLEAKVETDASKQQRILKLQKELEDTQLSRDAGACDV